MYFNIIKKMSESKERDDVKVPAGKRKWEFGELAVQGQKKAPNNIL